MKRVLVVDVVCIAGEGKSPEGVRTSLMASDVIREVLGYWRNRLEAAKAARGSDPD